LTASGPIQDLALDVAREAWRLGSKTMAQLARPQGWMSALALAAASAPTDELGVDRRMADTIADVVRPLARSWLGLEDDQHDALPARGGVLVLFNRSAWPLPVEPLVLWSLLREREGGGRRAYALWDADVCSTPFLGDWLQRIGIVAADPANCRLLLERGSIVIAFPEGSAARAKTYERRYRLERFDHASLLGAAVASGASIVPAAVLGNEESFPVIAHRGSVPITPLFPVAGAAGLLPLPLHWRLRFAPAVEYARVEEGSATLEGLSDAVRARMQAMLGEMIAHRRSIVGG
jgi:1-acyl-sn-glycerol-3-phosphate acyltransferase